MYACAYVCVCVYTGIYIQMHKAVYHCVTSFWNERKTVYQMVNTFHSVERNQFKLLSNTSLAGSPNTAFQFLEKAA